MEGKPLTGTVFNIQRYSVHDGAGIRTLVFMKGCPLRCIWCANPEGQSYGPVLSFRRQRCVNCGACILECPASANSMGGSELVWDKSRCTECLRCISVCVPRAREVCGKEYTIPELLKIVERDRSYFKRSGGGLTVGGGEPLSQGTFVAELLQEASDINIHTAMESCGFGEWTHLERILENLNTLFIDIKHMDSAVHKELTGVGNELILENICKAADRIRGSGKEFIIRIPVIPTLNDSEDNIRATAQFVHQLHAVKYIELLPYHNFGAGKYDQTKWTGEYTLHQLEPPSGEQMECLRSVAAACGVNVKVGS